MSLYFISIISMDKVHTYVLKVWLTQAAPLWVMLMLT